MGAMPTDGMKEEARRYRAWKEEGRKGGTDVAARRAGQILSGDELSDETIRTMSAWFARHEVDKQAEGFSPGEEGYPSPGRVAWAAWGGDPGKTWSDALVARMESDREMTPDLTAPQVQLYEAYEEIAESLASLVKMPDRMDRTTWPKARLRVMAWCAQIACSMQGRAHARS
jgi:hypothetical protein